MIANHYVNPLPGVPVCESPLFERLLAGMDLPPETERVARDLNRDGFAIIDFPDEEVDARAERIKRNLASRFDLPGWSRSTDDGLRLQDAWQFDPDVRAVACNARVIELLSQIYGRPAWPFQTLNFPVGTQQHFHTDSVHFSSMPERFMCGVWLALEDVDLEAGPLIYYPGSHKWPIYTNEHIGKTAFAGGKPLDQTAYDGAWEALVEAHGVTVQRFTPKRGQALIWAANLLHGGDRHNDRAKTRWSQVTHYYFDDCAYYTPMLSDPFAGRIQFRTPTNIATGKVVQNSYHGTPIDQRFIVAMVNGGAQTLPVAGFDAQRYLERNPDVRAAGVNPYEHYLVHGWREGRVW